MGHKDNNYVQQTQIAHLTTDSLKTNAGKRKFSDTTANSDFATDIYLKFKYY